MTNIKQFFKVFFFFCNNTVWGFFLHWKMLNMLLSLTPDREKQIKTRMVKIKAVEPTVNTSQNATQKCLSLDPPCLVNPYVYKMPPVYNAGFLL